MTRSKALQGAEVRQPQPLVTHSIPAQGADHSWRPGTFRKIFSYTPTTSSSQCKLPVGSDSTLFGDNSQK